jgi:type II secretory pathway predicted ATPase ExeA
MIEAYFGLNKAPFRLGSDEEFYFDSSMHARAMAYLKYGLQQSEGIVVLTGDAGVGKTTLVEHFITELENDVVASRLLGTKFEPGEILPQVMSVFGAEERGSTFAAQMKALEAYLAGQIASGKHVILVIDEAQNLPNHSLEEIRLLTTLSQGGRSLLQIFLVGQPELRARLAKSDMKQLSQRIVVSWTLKALDAEEAADYIDYRLLMAGWPEEESLFTEGAMQVIYRHTGGVPRLINRICARVLIGAALVEAEFVDETLVKQVVMEMAEEGLAEADIDDIASPEIETGDLFEDANLPGLEEDDLEIDLDLGAEPEEEQAVVLPFTPTPDQDPPIDIELADDDGEELTSEDEEEISETSDEISPQDQVGAPQLLSVLDRVRAAQEVAKEHQTRERDERQSPEEEISLEEIARQIREAGEEVAQESGEAGEDVPLTAGPVDLSLEQDEQAQEDINIDFDLSDDDIESHDDEQDGLSDDDKELLQQELESFVMETREELKAVVKSLEIISARLEDLDSRRTRRNRLVGKKLQEVETLLEKMRGPARRA